MVKRGMMIFVLGIVLLSASVSAVTKYKADEFFMSGAECVSKGYEKVFSLNGTDGKEYFYCLRMAPYSSSESFLVDSYLAFNVELCLSGYEIREIPFGVYKTAADRTNNITSTATLCRKRQSRSTENEIKNLDYKPFTDGVCTGIRDSFVDKNGKTIYHCQHWNPGVIPVTSGECEDTDGGDIKTIDEIESQYGIVLDEDAYGFDPPIRGLTFPAGETPAKIEEGENFVEVYKDYCVSRYKLHEHYCDVSTKTAKGIDIDCLNGGECDNGKCLNPGIGRTDQGDIEGCYDADSGANNFSISSYIDFFNNVGTGFRYFDVCANDGKKLFEYFCKNSEGAVDSKSKYKGEQFVPCNCSGGVCTGAVTPGEACADSGNCGKGEACVKNNDCVETLFCLNKICTDKYDGEYICEDSDSEFGLGEEKKSIFEPGKVTKGKIEIVDRCYGGHLSEATCAGSESTEPRKLIMKYEFAHCPEDDCKDDGNGGYCSKPETEKKCQRLSFNFKSGEDGNDICKDRYDDDEAWCDDGAPLEIEGETAPGCAGPGQNEIACSDDALQDLRAKITCCWNKDYNEDDGELEEGDAVPEKTSEESGGGFGDIFGGLMGLIPMLIPLIMAFI